MYLLEIYTYTYTNQYFIFTIMILTIVRILDLEFLILLCVLNMKREVGTYINKARETAHHTLAECPA